METLPELLDAVADDRFLPPDGTVTVLPQLCRRDAGVLAFTAHTLVLTDEDPAWVRATLAAVDCDPLAAPMHPRFLTALMDRTGRAAETVDALWVGTPLPGPPALALREIADTGHPRVVRARRRRDSVRVWVADGGLLVIGRGVGGRLEAALEVEGEGAGLGRGLALAARQLSDGPVWAQVSPGNARSVRAFLVAGYRPVGAELLLSARGGSTGCSGSCS
ncbi:GNAT family N-acetyltransferase [Streptomyces griseoluteus]|uniref:GNAT family N-acetyltransferase n=1 Tax=Streptomyces griseoluteus TaxID=29306 RepID=A0A4Z1DRZ1_STRGP|nr:GNAT family N-acetyltransferase [Streptomyces griseoluteus]TGN87579.1 GNAT family N-acetyltransferase [Streptomyces griseoluteus]GHF22621.1 N-acetyltransferase [Streptomyces griseoluteus]